MAGVVSVGEVIKPCVQAEVVEEGKELRAGVPKTAAGKIIKKDAALAIICIEEIFESKIVMIEEREIEAAQIVKAKYVIVGERQIIYTAPEKRLACEEGVWRRATRRRAFDNDVI